MLLTAPSPRPSGPDLAPSLDDYLPLVTYLVEEATFAARGGGDGPALRVAAEAALAEAVAGGATSSAEVSRRVREALARVPPAAPVPGSGVVPVDPLTEVLEASEAFGAAPAGRLEAALGGLPPAEERLLRSLYLEELPAAAVAQRLGLAPGDLAARRAAALRLLGAALERVPVTAPASEARRPAGRRGY